MKLTPTVMVLFLALLTASSGSAQGTKVPQIVLDSFASRYPVAKDVKWSNDIINYSVSFKEDNTKVIAKYEGKGIWKGSEKTWSYEQLPSLIVDAFNKTKYSGWPVAEVKIVSTPRDAEQYRLTIQKDELNKRNLFFNKEGRLVKDSFTL
jgi:hypothetical protein